MEQRLIRPSEEKIYIVKLNVLLILVSVLLLFIVIRLFILQVIEYSYYKKLALNSKQQIVRIDATRGEIYIDKGAKKIVRNIPSFSIYIVPHNIPKDKELRAQLVKRISLNFGVTEELVLNNLKSGRWYPYKPQLLLAQADLSKIYYLAENLSEYPGLYYQETPLRTYDDGLVFSHITGYLRKISPTLLKKKYHLGYHRNSIVGVNGIEANYDLELRGSDGYEYQIIDAKRRITGSVVPEDGYPVPGNDIYLTINSELQQVVYRMMQGVIGGCIVTKVSTGEVLALYSYPSFDPNIFTGNVDAEEFKKYLEDPDLPFYNRVIQGEYPPSSVYKIVGSCAALSDTKTAFYGTYYECTGGLAIGPQYYKCEGYHKSQNMYQALVNSCNSYYYALGMKMGHEVLKKWSYNYFHMGQLSGIDLPNERKGRVPDHKWKLESKGVYWWDGDTANMSIGQGFMLSTIVQMQTVISAIANDGVAYRPFLLHQRIDATSGNVIHENKPSILVELPMDIEHIRQVQKALRGVSVWGTARRGAASQLQIAGKTGTAQNIQGAAHGWFSCYAPYKAPLEDRLAVTVFAENGGHGGSAAAPIATAILESYFLKRKAENVYKRILQPWENRESSYQNWLQQRNETKLEKDELDELLGVITNKD